MSERVQGDAEELRAFAGRIRQFCQDTRSNQSQLRGHFNEVSRSWRDQVQYQFAREFEEASRLIDRFVQEVETEHLPYLQRKAQQIDDYTQGGD